MIHPAALILALFCSVHTKDLRSSLQNLGPLLVLIHLGMVQRKLERFDSLRISAQRFSFSSNPTSALTLLVLSPIPKYLRSLPGLLSPPSPSHSSRPMPTILKGLAVIGNCSCHRSIGTVHPIFRNLGSSGSVLGMAKVQILFWFSVT
jgi:hypothetical protein